jgi:hypothetical protein
MYFMTSLPSDRQASPSGDGMPIARDTSGGLFSGSLSPFRGLPRLPFERSTAMTQMEALWKDPSFLAAIEKKQVEGAREPGGQAAAPLHSIPALHAGAAPAAGSRPKGADQLKAQEHQNVETTKTLVILTGTVALHQTYLDLSIAVEKWANVKRKDIAALKPQETPTGGGLAFKIAKTLNSIAKLAFPEFKLVIENVGKGIGLAEKGYDTLKGDKQGDADSAQEVKEAQARANGELDDLITSTREEVIACHKKISDSLTTSMATADPAAIAQLSAIGKDQYQAIREFLAKNFNIKRGADVDPGIVKALKSQLNRTFDAWVKNDYRARHLGKVLGEAAGDGSVQKRFLAELYALYVSDDPDRYEKVKSRIAAAEQRNIKVFGAPWGYEKALEKIVHKLNEGYDKLYYGDAEKQLHQRETGAGQ